MTVAKQINNPLDNARMDRVHQVHLVGVGGCGMSAIAKILHKKGYLVTGSDIKESANTIRLRDLGVRVEIGHQETNVRGADLVVVSSAIYSDNPEIFEAQRRGVFICRRAEMLSWLMDQFAVRVAVAGTHGKTTTTSMLAQIFMHLDLDPTFLIGGETDSVEGNARLGASPYIVAEADESDGSFLVLNPNLAVITNAESDHLDYFGSLDEVLFAFSTFAKKLGKDGKLVINIDEKNAAALAGSMADLVPVYTYGLDPRAEVSADEVTFSQGFCEFRVRHKDKILGKVKLLVPGWQNVVNSLAAIYVGLLCGLDFSAMAQALQSFRGAKRRFQLIGEIGGIKIIDDYAHHPTELKMTLQAARLSFPLARLVCVFQPHRYTRTAYFYKEFGAAFADADLVIITDVYSAGEKAIDGVSGQMIVDEMKKNGKEIFYIPRKEKIAEFLLGKVEANDLVLVAGAGDINTVARELYSRLRMRENANPAA
ncbi:MAG: UDP-N-acetylmuramate--L-alanine ligase [Candidatus Margulisiibacteriota bacterium]